MFAGCLAFYSNSPRSNLGEMATTKGGLPASMNNNNF
jgi:hypothetical protein